MTQSSGADSQAKVAFFDFDGTLAHRDSLWPFLIAVAGFWQCMAGILLALFQYVFAKDGQDRRTIIKAALLNYTLKGRKTQDLVPAISRMRSWPNWITPTTEALKKHHEDGHKVVVATGSLDLYVQAMLGDLPVDAILCTRMEVKDGVLTGQMLSGNCVRKRKAELVAEYMKEHGPFAESWAYGNAPHDLPMMELTTHRVVI